MSIVDLDSHQVSYQVTYSIGNARRVEIITIDFSKSLNEDQLAKLSEHNFVLGNALKNNPAPENGEVDGTNFNPVSLTGNEANGVTVGTVEVEMPDGDAVEGDVTITVTKGQASRTFIMPTEFAQSQNYRRLRELETAIKAGGVLTFSSDYPAATFVTPGASTPADADTVTIAPASNAHGITLVSMTRTTNNLDSTTNTYSVVISLGSESYTFSIPLTFAKSFNQFMLDKLVTQLTTDTDTNASDDIHTFAANLNISDRSVAHAPTVSELSYAVDSTIVISRVVSVEPFGNDDHTV